MHVICDGIGIAQHQEQWTTSNTFFEIQDGGQTLCTVSKLKAFSSRCAFENVGNRTKTDLITLTFLNARDLSKIITL